MTSAKSATDVGKFNLSRPLLSALGTANHHCNSYSSCKLDAGRFDYTGHMQLCLICFFEHRTPSVFLAAITLHSRDRRPTSKVSSRFALQSVLCLLAKGSGPSCRFSRLNSPRRSPKRLIMIREPYCCHDNCAAPEPYWHLG